MMDRRTFLGLLPALLAAPSYAQGLIFRPSMPGVDLSYLKFALAGDQHTPGAPLYVTLPDAPDQTYAVYRPLNVTTAKLVVFCHGVLTEPAVYGALLTQWASHGFITIAPVYDDTVLVRGLEVRQDDLYGASTWDVASLFDVTEAEKRAKICSRIIDEVDAFSALVGLDIDFDNPIVVGHDLGAYTAQMLLGAKASEGDEPPAKGHHDNRFYGGVLLSSQGQGVMGLSRTSWLGISKPMMVVNGSRQADFTKLPLDRRWDPFELSAPGHKYRVEIADGEHRLPTMRPDPSRRAPGAFDDLAAVTTLFLQTYGRLDRAALEMLHAGGLARAAGGRVTIETR